MQIVAEIPTQEEQEASAPPPEQGADGTVVRLVNQLIADAVHRGASDIHIEPNGAERPVTIRLRIDGECEDVAHLPPSLRSVLAARIKIMSGLDIAERRRPQDGKLRLKVGDKMMELRVATLPTVNGNEDVVMRVLASSKPMKLDACGLTAANLDRVQKAIARPYGLILCVGPTGSGKTTTLHTMLGALNQPDTKIWTAEDPVEITQAGLRQVQIQTKIGLDFAAALRSFLRADPDVIMVGEMRDKEAAGMAVEASLTGHLVLSTLHTNSAPETIVRLLDMGLDPFSFADALVCVLAQRLARRVCVACREEREGTQVELDALNQTLIDAGGRPLEVQVGAGFRLWRGKGCATCGESGYKGRVALHEVLLIDDGIKAMIHKRASAELIRDAAMHAGMRTLLEDGVAKTLAGETDLRQVIAVCSR